MLRHSDLEGLTREEKIKWLREDNRVEMWETIKLIFRSIIVPIACFIACVALYDFLF